MFIVIRIIIIMLKEEEEDNRMRAVALSFIHSVSIMLMPNSNSSLLKNDNRKTRSWVEKTMNAIDGVMFSCKQSNRNCLTVPRCRLSTYGCRAFDYAGPTVWNSLPDELRYSDSFDSVKQLNNSWKQLFSLAATSPTSALEVIFIMRCAI